MISSANKLFFIFEMANNHMGDFEHGCKIIQQLKLIKDKYPEFKFSIKLQYRDDSFFHKNHIHRKDHKLIKRFTETRLGNSNFAKLVENIKKSGFTTMCTPWDEKAVKFLDNINVDIFKIASCSFNDWSLLEEIAKYKKPIIASTAGAEKIDIDKVYSFFKNKRKILSLLHCVGEYPTEDSNLELNQITFLKENYPDCRIGYSTHENPNNYDNVKIALAKGAEIFEKHVGIEDNFKNYKLNPYSANIEQIDNWLLSAKKTLNVIGGKPELRKSFSKKEMEDLKILYRGAYAKKNISKGEIVKKSLYLAMPNVDGQLVAKDFGMFKNFISKINIKKDEPLFKKNFNVKIERDNAEEIKFRIKDKLENFLSKSKIALPRNVTAEISHHFGINNFFSNGAILIHLINREYSKIIVVMFANQKYPEHYHIKKDETYYIIHGDLEVNLNKKKYKLKPGDTLSVKRNEKHSFKTKNGVIFEEIATKYIIGDSIYTEEKLLHSNRKTNLSIF
jgi:sialic acid synthase SpsE/mannose-6-phosphate isomerase-like protein (cupin superfamily)